MSKEGMEKIKAKLQELAEVVKEEAAVSGQEIKQDLIKTVNEIKEKFEDKIQNLGGATKETMGTVQEKVKQAYDNMVEKTGEVSEKTTENVNEMMDDLEYRALKVQYALQEKYSAGREKKDEVVVKTADALVESIQKMKKALVSEDKKE